MPGPSLAQRLAHRKVKHLEDAIMSKSIHHVKLVWAFTLGVVTEQRRGKDETNFAFQCRYRSLELGHVALVDSNSALHNRNDAMKVARKNNYYLIRIVTLITLHAGDEDAIVATFDVVLAFCKLLSKNEDVHRENVDLIQSTCAVVYASKVRKGGPCKVQLEVCKHAAAAAAAVAAGEEEEDAVRPLPERNFVLHCALRPEAWREAAILKRKTFMAGRCFKHAAWECCPPVALNQHLARWNILARADSREKAAVTRCCIALVCRWLRDHLDTKNLILLTCFSLGLAVERHSTSIMASLDLGHLYLFPRETDRFRKHVYEAYRGPRVKEELVDLHRLHILPLLTLQGLVNVYNFCYELRFSLAHRYVCQRASDETFRYLCAYSRRERARSVPLGLVLGKVMHFNVHGETRRWPRPRV